MMLIQSFEKFDRVAKLDPASGKLSEFDRPGGSARLPEPIMGQYGRIGDRVAILYRDAGRLYLAIDDFVVEFGDSVLVDVDRGPGGVQTFTLWTDGAPCLRLEYDSPASLDDDPTAFVEDEDFDYGLFLANVSKDASRRERLFRT